MDSLLFALKMGKVSDVSEEKKRRTAKKIARGVLMNVFINTSAKVKQNKLTKQSKRYDDGFHDSDTQRIHRTTSDVTQKISMYFSHRAYQMNQPTQETQRLSPTNRADRDRK